jgi:hypothetical protein
MGSGGMIYVLWHDAWTPELCSQRSTAETSIATQRLSKQISAHNHIIIEELLEVVISIRVFPKI